MNVKNPLQIVFTGSSIIALLLFAVLFTIHLSIDSIHWSVLVFAPLFTFIFSLITFYFFIKKLIDSRISVIYRTIRKEKLKGSDNVKSDMRKDVLGDLSKETKIWAEDRKEEISKLRAQEEFRKEFLGNLAHELKTPIFSIQGYILSLLEGGLEDPSVNREFLLRASKGVDRMTHIIEDLDDITRFESNRFELEVKTFDIVDLATEVIESVEFRAQNKNIKLGLNKDYDPIKVKADRAKISQVLTNLISNSISYGNENGKTEVRFHKLEDAILVEVADNGPGISEEHLSRLFERFYRVDKSRARNSGGSGLGLAIAKHIIESHGQDIDVRSTVGLGSTFSFTLEKA